MIDPRWKTAIHESGHALAAIVLGGKCLGIVLYPDGGGQTHFTELLGDREAFAIAAGQAAERLAQSYAAPECLPTAEIETVHLRESSPFLACQLSKGSDVHKEFVSDDRYIALWAIGGNESEPERWVARVAHAHRVAVQIVETNAAAIVRVAAELFVRGNLCRDEITELFEGVKS